MRLLLVTILAVLAFAGTAQGMEKGMQEDGMSPQTCDQIATQKVKWVRLSIAPEDWSRMRAHYLATAQRCKADGLKVMVTIVHWRGRIGQPGYLPGLTASQLAFAAAVAAHDLAPYVDAWSPINEPNHSSFAPAYDPRCTIGRHYTTTKRTVRYKRLKHKRGWYKRVRGHRFKRLKHRRGWYKRVVKVRRVTTLRQIPAGADRCMARGAAAAYQAAAVQIRRFDPTAKLILGDTAGPGSAFVTAMLEEAHGSLDADVYAQHYSPPSAATRAIAKRLGLQLWVTEWGLAPAYQVKIKDAVRTVAANGASVLIYYHGLSYNAHWMNTQLTPAALAAFKAI